MCKHVSNFSKHACSTHDKESTSGSFVHAKDGTEEYSRSKEVELNTYELTMDMNKAIFSRLTLDFCLESKPASEESSGVYAEICTMFSSYYNIPHPPVC